MDQTHVEETCEWCGEKFTDAGGRGRRYCSCATAAWFTPRARRGSRRIPSEEPENWKEKLTEAARVCGAGKRGKRVRLVWLEKLMETSVEGLAGRLFLGWDDRHSPGEWENIREAVRRSPAFACAAEGFQEDRRLAASGLPVPELRELFRNRCLFPEEDMERLSVRRAGETDPV